MMKVTVQHIDGLWFLATVGRHMVVVDPATEDRGGGSPTSLDQTGTKCRGWRNESRGRTQTRSSIRLRIISSARL
jgi:hypothetical protein